MTTSSRIRIFVPLFLVVSMLLCLCGFASPSEELEASVLSKVKEIYRRQGQVNFSELYNSDRFSTEEREYLGRLYEIFFAIPKFLATEQRSTGHLPTRAEIARSFGIGEKSVALLLSVMESDPRVPRMFTRNADTGEIESIDLGVIDAFVAARGSNVKMTKWEGQPLPGFSLPTLKGERLSSAQLSGHPIVLYFWFSGCPPCVRLAPILADLSREYGPRGVRFVGMNADEVLGIGTDDATRRDYAAREGITFPVANLDETTRREFGQVNVFPTLFFVDRSGVIRHHLVNFQDRETLDSILREML